MLSELLNEVNLLLGRLSSLDELTQAEEEETAAGGGSRGVAVTLRPSDRFCLREVCFDAVVVCLHICPTTAVYQATQLLGSLA